MKLIPISIEFEIGQIVYLRTDPDQQARLVTGYSVRANGVTYAISHGTNESYHYAFEMSEEKSYASVQS